MSFNSSKRSIQTSSNSDTSPVKKKTKIALKRNLTHSSSSSSDETEVSLVRSQGLSYWSQEWQREDLSVLNDFVCILALNDTPTRSCQLQATRPTRFSKSSVDFSARTSTDHCTYPNPTFVVVRRLEWQWWNCHKTHPTAAEKTCRHWWTFDDSQPNETENAREEELRSTGHNGQQ